MKAWSWLLIGAVWLALVVTVVVRFYCGRGVAGVRIPYSKWLPKEASFAIARLLLVTTLFGWVVPLAIGIREFLLEK